MKTELEPITLEESIRLTSLETIIRNGEQTFVEVGTALLEIRDSKLYRYEYQTFEAYCTETWGWGSSRARQLCAAASVAKSVTTGNALNERSARELAKVEPEKREEVIKKAASKGKVTAKSIKEAAEPETTEPATPHTTTLEQEVAEFRKLDIPGVDPSHIEPRVTHYYSAAEDLVDEACRIGTDKQLNSLLVALKMLPAKIKEELNKRKSN